MMNRAKMLLLVGAVVCCGAAVFVNTMHAQDHKSHNKTRYVRVFDNPRAPVFHYDETAQQIVKVLPAVFEDLGLPGGRDAKDDSVYLTPYLKIQNALFEGELNSKYFDCGDPVAKRPVADLYTITFALITITSSDPGGGSSIRVLLSGYARDKGATSTTVECFGTGVLERRIDGLIRYHNSKG